jgi:glyoxylase-like metal-dependent hydrolase (beta-lactamase superfamily II)
MKGDISDGHADHAGAASEIAAATGAPVALRAEDAGWVREGLPATAPPVTRSARAIAQLLSARSMQGVMRAPRFDPEVVIEAEELSLAEYGVAATVIHTPGHTAGSVSVLLEDGRVLVGDLAMNGLPSSPFKPTPPIVAQDLALLRESWSMIHKRGARTIFPGHGAAFAWEALVMRV